MRNVILGTVAGLILGTVGALAYSHYLGDGSLLADLQDQLDAANANLAAAKKDKQQLSTETTGVSDQVDQLQASNEDLRKQLDALKSAPPSTNAAPLNPLTLAGMMMGMGRGGGFQTQQRMFLLKTRLHLTPDQEAAVKAAMDADGKARRDLMQQMFRNNGKVDPAAAANANTLDATLAKVLQPDQMDEYKQVQADEQTSRADTTATVQVNQIAPLLQLSDSQKDAAFNALYQAQSTAQDPVSLIGNPNAMAVLTTQAQATQAALAKVLTPDQLAIYQAAGSSIQMGGFGGFGGRRGGNGGGNGGNAATTAGTPAVTATPAATPAATTTPAATGQ